MSTAVAHVESTERIDRPVLALVDYITYMGPVEMLVELAAGEFDYLFIFSMRTRWDARTAQDLRDLGFRVELLDDVVREPSRVAHCAGITSIGDQTLRETARIAEAVGLRHYHSPAVADTISEKVRQRRAFAAHGLPQPAWAEIDAGEDGWWERVPEGLRSGSMVLKPSRGWGSSGVVRVTDLDQAREVIGTDDGLWLLEGEIVGGAHPLGDWLSDCLSVQTMTVGGVTHLFGVMDKPPTAPPFKPTGDLVPSQLSADLRRRCEEVALGAVAALGIRNGWCHTELKLGADGPEILEVNGRMTSTIHDACVRLYGTAPIRIWFDVVLGRRPEVPEFDYGSRIVCQYLAPAPRTPVPLRAAHRIADELRTLPQVFDVRILDTDALDGDSGTSVTTAPLAVWLEVRDSAELRTSLETVKESLAEIGL
ncbi:ATP-grasp domain-containing protein [Pseudonocardia pini]|uniref:ATP-grasp domain-containing protein n=1 Tax=Pseudonocardia pini TaxID=2758030 RepID=UPI0015F05ADA|nr:ATP-grasp domain-containing protein [Pseudonocardia pini]